MASCIENKTFEEISVGDTASLTRTLTRQDIQIFAIATGDMNPAHLDEHFAKNSIFHQIVGHGMWTGSMFSVLLGMQLPGPGTIYLRQTLNFLAPVKLDDTVTASVTVTAKEPKKKHITLKTLCVNQSGKTVVEGEAEVLAPTEKICWDISRIPNIPWQDHHQHYYDLLLERMKKEKPKPLKTAVIHPVDKYALQGALEAAQAGIIEPILVGPELKIRAAAKEVNMDLAPYRIVNTQHSDAAAEEGVRLARTGEVEALMKGSLHTDELMKAVIDKEKGLRTGRRMSHVFVVDVPSYPKPMFVTDAAINIAPTLAEKKDILQNAVDLFHALGLGTPLVAVLSAVETVNEAIPSTLDATALCKMAERGQITGAIVDGPLAFDNAVSMEAAQMKGIRSEVAGKADILVVPDLESGNMLYKELNYFSGAHGMGIVLGARVPIILTSRAGDAQNRMSSCVLALAYMRAEKSMKAILILNAGSSNIKCALFDADSLSLVGKSQLRSPEEALEWATQQQVGLAAVGHRVVHGGREFSQPVALTPEIMDELDALSPLAPLHQPHNLDIIRACADRFASVTQVACFDTAFHHTAPDLERWIPLPRSFHDEGVVRYGFHGLSYEHIASLTGAKYEKVVAAHLGSGSSVCAMLRGESVATTMGFSALDGLMMGTRTGSVDPGVLLYLLEEKGYDAKRLSDLLYKESGLKGISGISAEMKDLEVSNDVRAAFAVDLYCYLAAKHIASLIPALGGIDLLVFTGGIGEHSKPAVEKITVRLSWLGVGTSVPVQIIPANEELVIAKACKSLCSL